MKRFWKNANKVRLCMASPDPFSSLSEIVSEGIIVENIRIVSPLTVEFWILKGSYKKLRTINFKRGETFSVESQWLLRPFLGKILQRPFFVGEILLIIFFSLYLTSHILFLSVQGNTTIPAKLIAETVLQCGIEYGISSRKINSEEIKNRLLNEIPNLKWAGIRISGAMAVVDVREREEVPDSTENITSIVAARDGIVDRMLITKGKPVCTIGESVRKGETLVSGYADAGNLLRYTGAEAEIYGKTFHNFQAVSPRSIHIRLKAGQCKYRYSIIIGKNIIKLYIDSGIPPACCGKMYRDYFIILPGGFYVPISLRREMEQQASVANIQQAAAHDFTWLAARADTYLFSRMNAGEILQREVNITRSSDLISANLSYRCLEQIGKLEGKEIVPRGR